MAESAPLTATLPIEPPSYVGQGQCYFGPAPGHMEHRLADDGAITVLRWRPRADAEIVITIMHGGSYVSARVRATPKQMRRIAAALVSAAHDIEVMR